MGSFEEATPLGQAGGRQFKSARLHLKIYCVNFSSWFIVHSSNYERRTINYELRQ